MEQVGMFLGETAKYLGEHWWIWLVCAAGCWLVSYSIILMKKVLVLILDEEAAGYSERGDLALSVLEKAGMSALRASVIYCQIYGFVFKCASFAFCLAFIVGIGYLFIEFICRAPL